MDINSLHYSDRLVLSSVKTLHGRTVTTGELASHASVPLSTTKIAIKRLKKFGLITRQGGGRRWGYTYQVLPHTSL